MELSSFSKMIIPAIVFIVLIISFGTICYSALNEEKHWAGIDFSKKDENKKLSRWYEYVYFASTTVSTAGYGDIYPTSIHSKGLTLLVQILILIGITSLFK